MKSFIKTALLGALLLCGGSAIAQQKFGHINFEELVMLMPERDSMELKINRLSADYSEMLELMQVDFNNKYQEYQQKSATYTDTMRQAKERELQELQTRMQQLYTDANTDLQNQQNELLAPIFKKAEDAIKKVGVENKFFAIYDTSSRVMIYVDEENMVDIMPLVKKELGLK